MLYRVTQRSNRFGMIVHSKTYSSRLWAIIVAWTMAGKGFDGDSYTTTVEEIDQ